MKRFSLILTVVVAAGLTPGRVDAQWKYGWSTEFFVPLGDLAEISLIGLSAEVYAGTLINRSKWAMEVDAGIHWFIPDDVAVEDVPVWIPDPEPNNNGIVRFSGSFIPVRASLTRFLGRYYLMPRVGVYFPVGQFRKDVPFKTSFGIAPRLGYLFPVTRDMQFDFALEYDYLFGDLQIHYVGVSMGLLFGGRRLGRR